MHNPALLYVMSLGSKKSREMMTYKLIQMAKLYDHSIESYPWTELDPMRVQLIINELESKGLSFASVNAYLSALKGVAKQAWRNGDMDGDVLARIKDIRSRKGYRLPVGQSVEQTDIDKLLATCEANPNPVKGIRDAAILALGFFVGLRRSEIGKIKVSDIHLTSGTLRVIGKGNKERKIPLPSIAQHYLHQWLTIRKEQIIEHRLSGDYLFGQINARRARLINLNGILGRAIWLLLKETCLASGIDFNTLPTPHDMRRTAVTRWLQGGDPRVAQALAGHEHIQTTMSYARDDLTDKMKNLVEI
jgi:site-specific recombinase XerD